jgi:uncharacterized protein YdaT
MPWTPDEFASRHNKKLKGHAAKKASEMANAMIKEGVPENVAIATANKHGNKLMRQGTRGHRSSEERRAALYKET